MALNPTNSDALPNLIRLIYDAAGDPQQWPSFLKEFSEQVKAKSAGLVVVDSQTGQAQVDQSFNVDPARQQSFVQHYSALNPWTSPQAAHLWSPGRIMDGREIISDAEMLRTEFYNGFLKPQGWFSAIGGALTRNESTFSYITALRPREVPAEFGRPVLKALMPHLQSAIRLHERIYALERRVTALSEVLDYLPGGVLMTDSRARVLVMNRAAESLLARECGLTSKDGTLCAIAPGETEMLRETIRRALAARDGGTAAPIPLRISRPTSARPLQVVVAPLPAQEIGTAGQPAAILFVADPDDLPQPNQLLLQETFAFTEAEARVAVALAQGKSLEETSEEFHISVDTIRTQLKRMFSKTGTHRQGDLIRVLLTGWSGLRQDGR